VWPHCKRKGSRAPPAHGLIAGVPHVLESPYPYVFLVTSIVGLLIFQSGLQRSRVAVIGPFSSIVASVYVVVVGMLIFHETLPTTACTRSFAYSASLWRWAGVGSSLRHRQSRSAVNSHNGSTQSPGERHAPPRLPPVELALFWTVLFQRTDVMISRISSPGIAFAMNSGFPISIRELLVRLLRE